MKKFFRATFCIMTMFLVNICAVTGYYALNLPDSYYVSKGTTLSLATKFDIEALTDESVPASLSKDTAPSSETAQLRLFGIVPVKDVEIHTVETPVLVPGGDPFGIKLLMNGVMVVGTGEIKSTEGMVCPAEECGIEEGDIILSIDGRETTSNSDIQETVSKSNGNPLEVVYIHDETRTVSMLTPVFSLADSSYKAGMWVRDSTAGIGTVTFYEPSTGRFAGLGHPVCDSDTGEIVPISTGEATNVEICDVIPGTCGSPGELQGVFTSFRTSGVIYSNNKYGVFGEIFRSVSSENAIPMGLKQEIKAGPAVIRCTTDEEGPKEYDIVIENIDLKNTDTKNMTIRVTDPQLLSRTGGIVQGMSGSPIIQNGKLIGAVTHVFVSDPTRGYGIFAENMYESGLCS